MSGTITQRLVNRAARAYIAGPSLEDAFRVCTTLAGGGFGSSIGYWNGNESREDVARQYLLALAGDALRHADCYLSVKAPALGFDPGLLRQVANAARRCCRPVHFDSLGPESADATFRTIEGLLQDYETLGCTLPGRWRRSISDSDLAVRLGLRVRVVKGQWADSDADPNLGFLAVVETLAGRAAHVGIATHDAGLAKRSLGRLLASGTSCELELLWGLPSAEPLRVARELRVPARFYVPYGSAWLPYALSQALRRPRTIAWFLHDVLLGLRTPAPLKPHRFRMGTRVPFL